MTEAIVLEVQFPLRRGKYIRVSGYSKLLEIVIIMCTYMTIPSKSNYLLNQNVDDV